jgi:hypothetical protein
MVPIGFRRIGSRCIVLDARRKTDRFCKEAREMKRVMVEYRVKPDQVAANEQLVRDVYEELERTQPDGLRYGTFKLADGVSFVHLAEHRDENPLQQVAAFQRFQQGIVDRCDVPPVVSQLEEIGSYRFMSEPS